jgi:hypothetical protein
MTNFDAVTENPSVVIYVSKSGGTFGDLAGVSTGFTRDGVSLIRRNCTNIVNTLSFLLHFYVRSGSFLLHFYVRSGERTAARWPGIDDDLLHKLSFSNLSTPDSGEQEIESIRADHVAAALSRVKPAVVKRQTATVGPASTPFAPTPAPITCAAVTASRVFSTVLSGNTPAPTETVEIAYLGDIVNEHVMGLLLARQAQTSAADR